MSVAIVRNTATASCSAPSPFRLLTLRKSCRPEKRRGAGGEKRDSSFAPAGPWSRSASRRAGAHEPALHGVTATAVCSTLFGSGVALAPGGVASRSRGAFTSARRRPVCRSSSASAGSAPNKAFRDKNEDCPLRYRTQVSSMRCRSSLQESTAPMKRKFGIRRPGSGGSRSDSMRNPAFSRARA